MKVTWRTIFEEFKNKHPEMSNDIISYRPSTYMEIAIKFKDDREMTYNYETKEVKYAGDINLL